MFLNLGLIVDQILKHFKTNSTKLVLLNPNLSRDAFVRHRMCEDSAYGYNI